MAQRRKTKRGTLPDIATSTRASGLQSKHGTIDEIIKRS
jgi:hypothetical protein